MWDNYWRLYKKNNWHFYPLKWLPQIHMVRKACNTFWWEKITTELWRGYQRYSIRSSTKICKTNIQKSGIIVAYTAGYDECTMREYLKWICKECEKIKPTFIYSRYIGGWINLNIVAPLLKYLTRFGFPIQTTAQKLTHTIYFPGTRYSKRKTPTYI